MAFFFVAIPALEGGGTAFLLMSAGNRDEVVQVLSDHDLPAAEAVIYEDLEAEAEFQAQYPDCALLTTI